MAFMILVILGWTSVAFSKPALFPETGGAEDSAAFLHLRRVVE
ncbi:hypothetical protein [Undibacterium sp.]